MKNHAVFLAVYMERMQEFAMRFRRQGSLPPLSPLPQLRASAASPCRKVSDSHSVFTRPLKPSYTNVQFASSPLSYSFNKSPRKVRKELKVLLFFDDNSSVANRFWPVGSGSISQRYGSGSGYFYHQAKIVRKS
jgi:hypothetical protein